MSESSQPAMSVVLVTPDHYQTIARTISALRSQSVAEQLELVIVAPDLKLLDVPATEQLDFGAVRFVEIGGIKRVAAAHAAGVRAATTAVVAFAEDHAFPQPGWAEALIAAHRGPWTVVGPAVLNANPENLTSWADFLLGYGRWRVPVAAGPTDHLPGHNSSYKRAALLSYGNDLTERLQVPALLHADLAARGFQLYLEPAAVVSHMNFASAPIWLHTRFHSGRAFAAARAGEWPVARRMIYSLATPLVPLVRLARIFHESRRKGQPAGFFLRIAPLLGLGLAVDAVGELIGYLCKPPENYEREWDWEFRRETQV